MKAISGRSAFLDILRDEGVSILFGNPGTTELPIMDALAAQHDVRYVLGLQENAVMSMADGYARASGRLAACNVHVAPGLGNALGALYNAKYYGSPVIITAGQQEQGFLLTEPLLYDSLVDMAAPLVKWAVEIHRLEDLPRILRRAAKVALTPPTGPVFISLPGDVLNQSAEMDLGASTTVLAETRPSDALLERMAERLLAAAQPAMVVGPEVCHEGAFAEVAAVAEVIGAAVFQQPLPYTAQFSSTHPLYMGALPRTAQELRNALQFADLLVAAGADVFRMSVPGAVEPLPDGLPIVHVGSRDWELGKVYPTELAVHAQVKTTMAALADRLRARQTPQQAQAAADRSRALRATNWRAKREQAVQKALGAADNAPIDPAFLMMTLAENTPADGVIVDEGLTSSRPLLDFLPMEDPRRYFGLASGGIGWGLPGAVGVNLALPERPMICISGDGSAMYNVQALWTAAHHNLPITFVIANNFGYRILKQRLYAYGGDAVAQENMIGMDFTNPEIDITGLSNALGVPATTVTRPQDVAPTLQEAMAAGGPRLLDIHVYGGYRS